MTNQEGKNKLSARAKKFIMSILLIAFETWILFYVIFKMPYLFKCCT